MRLSEKCQEVLEICSHTGSWVGVPIHSLSAKNWLDDTPLHTVCTWGELEPVKILVEEGADVNASGDHGATPIFNALIGGNIHVIKYLISKGADVNRSNDWGCLPKEYAKSAKVSKDIMELLESASKKNKKCTK